VGLVNNKENKDRIQGDIELKSKEDIVRIFGNTVNVQNYKDITIYYHYKKYSVKEIITTNFRDMHIFGLVNLFRMPTEFETRVVSMNTGEEFVNKMEYSLIYGTSTYLWSELYSDISMLMDWQPDLDYFVAMHFDGLDNLEIVDNTTKTSIKLSDFRSRLEIGRMTNTGEYRDNVIHLLTTDKMLIYYEYATEIVKVVLLQRFRENPRKQDFYIKDYNTKGVIQWKDIKGAF
jgi:hypothetical protein